MKFSEFVGESGYKRRDIQKKIVDTSLGKTDEDFYNVVARRDKPYIIETSIGYGLSKLHLKRTFDYIKSWLIRYDIKYEAVNPYLTVANVEGDYKRDRLIKALKKVRKSHVFEPEGIFILREGDTDFIIIDYIFHRDFVKGLDECLSNFSLAKKNSFSSVKLFSLKVESFPLQLFDEMVYSLPEIPDVRPGSVGLLVRRR